MGLRSPTYHEGPDHDVGHLGQLVVQQGRGGVVCHLGTEESDELGPPQPAEETRPLTPFSANQSAFARPEGRRPQGNPHASQSAEGEGQEGRCQA